jgi:hypothetical protein
MKDVEVLAVEVKQFNGENLKTLVPRVIGQTSQAEQIKNPGQKRQWDEQSFMEDLLKKVPSEDVSVVKKLLEWAYKNTPRIWWGQGSQNGSFYPIIDLPNISRQVFSVWTSGKVEIEFQWMSRVEDPEKLLTFREKLNAIPGVHIPENAMKGRPSFSISILRNEENYSRFINAVEWFERN